MSRPRARSGYKPILARRWLQSLTFRETLPTFVVIGRVHITTIDVPWRMEIDRIAYFVGDAQAGNVRVGIYAEGTIEDDPETGELMWESGSVVQAATYRWQFFDIDPALVLPAGRYYLAVQGDDATGTYAASSSDAEVATDRLGWNYDHGYGAFTDPCPAVVDTTNTPIILLKVSRNLV